MLALVLIVFIALCNLALGLVVLLKNRGNFTNISFSIFAFMLSVWLVITYYSNDTTLSYDLQLWLNRLTVFMPALALYFLLLFSLEFTRQNTSKYFRPFAVLFGFTTLAVSIISMTPLVVKEIYPHEGIIAMHFGIFTPIFSLFIIGEFVAIVTILTMSSRRLTGAAKVRTQIMTASLFLALIVTFITNLIMPVVFNNFRYVPLGLLSTIIIVGGFTYAIIKHRLFDIRSVVARSIAYFLLLATLGSLYGFVTFNVGNMLFSQSSVSIPQQTFNVIAALVLAFTFQPLQHFFEKVTDHVFYRDHYDPETLLNQVSHVLATEISLIELSRKVRNLLAKHMRVDSVDIVVLNNDKVFAESGHYVVSRLEELADDFNQLRGKVLIADEELNDKRRQVLEKYGVSVMAALRTKKDGRVGYLLFSSKLSGDIFTNTDLQVISTIADQLAIAIQNAKAYVEIQRFNQTLRSKVTVATQKLREANTDLKQLDIVKDDFLSMASHQLRTPLTVVEGYISNVLDGNYGELNHKQKEAIKLTQSRVRLTRALVVDLLNISRIEAGRFFLDIQPTNLNQIVLDEIDHLEVVAKEQNTKVVFDKPKTPVPIASLDDQKMRQVVMNLVENAIQYSPGGKVTVGLEATSKQIEFTVKDNGIGVPKSQQSNLFTKFFRADNAKRARPDGTGIGLFMVKEVVEAHKGHTIFLSEEKKGSVFGFSIPIAALNRTAPKTKPEPALAVIEA